MPRIAIAGFQHETNTFAPFPTAYEDFEKADGWPGLTRGDDILEVFPGLTIPIGGFIRAAADWTLLPLVWASAEPAAAVSDEAFERIAGMICDGLAGAGGLDGVYLDLHGAMVAESFEDGEGELLRRVRAVVGPDLPVVASLDFHANLTAAMVEQASALAIFRTYPHIDMPETAVRARHLLARLLETGRPFEKAWRQFPFLVPLSSQATTMPPLDRIYAGLGEMPEPGVASVDIAMGFPPADIYDSGGAAVVYGEDPAVVGAALDRLYDSVCAAEPALEDRLLDESEAVRGAQRIVAESGGPVVLADVQDNPGAGGSSDTTGLLKALVEQEARGAALAALWDPKAAARAHAAGPEAELRLALGGRYAEAGGGPFDAHFLVERVTDGRFTCTGEMYAGSEATLGRMALLRVLAPGTEVRVIVSSERFQSLDLAVFRHMGIEPTEQNILAVKSTVHFLADFAPIASEVLFVDSPGAHPCRLDRVTYSRLRPGVRLGPGGPES
jgi:microcystin degradation protein MlrC